MPLRILIAEDQLMVRQGLNALLEQAGFEVVGGASDGREALRLVKELHPEVVIMDLSMPVTNGLETARKIRKILPTTEVILLTVHDEDQYVLEAMRDGVSGYVLKSRALEDLVRAIHEVSEHRVYLSPGISDVVVRAYMAKASIAPDLLSDRERQVLQLVAQGKTTREVAQLLGISYKTAETHRSRIKAKLDIHDTAGLVRYAIRRGLVEA
ncbi:MAG: DNA-binding response regulator [Acidobacteria bacterium]|nr:MAG: DNA-binding response regulator [Acidobacteriota bacterium]